MHKNIGFFIVAILLIFSTSLVVSANQSQNFNLTAVALSTAVGKEIKPDQLFTYGVLSATHTGGNAAAHVGIQVYYNNKYVELGNKTISLTNGKSAKIAWYPNKETNWPSGVTNHINCSDSVNSDYHCINPDYTYSVLLKNNNLFNAVSVAGTIEFTDN